MKTRKPGWPYPDVAIFIGDGSNTERGERLPVINSVSDETIGEVPKASRFDLDRAVAAGEAGFAQWNKVTPLGREKILKKSSHAAGKRDAIALTLPFEHGKPLAEARGEITARWRKREFTGTQNLKFVSRPASWSTGKVTSWSTIFRGGSSLAAPAPS